MITLQQIQDLSLKMKAAPRLENFQRKVGKDEALLKLMPAMKTMQANGYDIEQIAAMLADVGLKVSVRSLARILKPKPKLLPQ